MRNLLYFPVDFFNTPFLELCSSRFLGSRVQGRRLWRGFGGVPQAPLSFAAIGGVPGKPTLVNFLEHFHRCLSRALANPGQATMEAICL